VDIIDRVTAEHIAITPAPTAAAVAPAEKVISTAPTVLVRELGPEDREAMITHFLALASDDRLLRFGHLVSDHIVANYVRAIDFESDSVFGVYDDQLRLLGVGHLAGLGETSGKRSAELGVSVLERARGQGIGSHLFARAAIHCRNTDIESLYMHCLSRNATMMHIAKKAGMAIKHAYGEADAYLTLPPADSASILLEQRQEQVAASDYARKRHARLIRANAAAVSALASAAASSSRQISAR
jgi:GNAT superfamily N-acetyltransferase